MANLLMYTQQEVMPFIKYKIKIIQDGDKNNMFNDFNLCKYWMKKKS